MKKLLIAYISLLLSLAYIQADETKTRPVTYDTGSSITITPGVPLLGTWDLSGATLIGVTASTTWGSITGSIPAQTDLQSALDAKVNLTRTINGHPLSSNVVISASDVGLGSVTNDAQTKASIVPNTSPSSGQVLIGNAGGAAYAKQSITGSGATISLNDTGVITISGIPNASLSNSAITIAGTSTPLGTAITQDTITGLSSIGLVKRTGANTLATITDNSSNWDTGFADRLKWDGGATGLVPATGRTSLGLVIGINVEAWNPNLDLWAALAPSAKQDADSDLSTIAGLTATTDNFMVSVASAWASRTPAQVRATLALVIGTNVEAWSAVLDTWAAITRASGFDAFVATPSGANLAALLTDETGSGVPVFNNGGTTSNEVVGTQSAADNSTKAASTAYADALISNTAFSSAFDGVNAIGMSKNVFYDYVHLFDTDDDGLPNKLDAVSGTGSGVIAVNSSNVLSAAGMTSASGSSSSGTAGTNIATITAAGGNQFVCINGVSGQASAAGTQILCTVTYSDATTTTDTTGAASTQQQIVNSAAIWRSGSGVVAHSAKKITAIAFVTAGTGTGARFASVSALEIPQ